METEEPDDSGLEPEWRELLQDVTRRFGRRFSKGFLSGIALHAGVKFVSALMRNPFRENIPHTLRSLISTDSLRFATFLGLYPSVYELVKDIIQRYRLKKDGFNNMIAGGIAGLTIILEEPTRRRVFSLFAIARAFGALISTLVARKKLPEIAYSETILFCLCCAFLVYCTALNPRLLFTGYYYSVLKWSRDYTDKKLNILFRSKGDRFLTCQEVGLHKDGCTTHALKDFVKSFPGFAKLYLPIHITPILVFRRKLLMERPLRVLKSLAKNVIFSTAFLASMASLAKYVICLLRNQMGRPPPLPAFIPAIGGAVCGLSVLFERANRRKELSLFLIPHSLYALYLWGLEKKLLRHIHFSSVVLFSVSMMSVMHAYEREPESLSLLINGVLKYFVGESSNVRLRPKRVKTFSEMLS